MTLPEIEARVERLGMKRFTASQIARWLYVGRVSSIDEMANISKANRALLSEQFQVGRSAPVETVVSKDGTEKYLFAVGEHYVETVYIPDGERATLCVSSQVGCRMGCHFCQTGRQGWQGNLTATDILNQIYSVPKAEKLTNIVFMGQGEPLDNIDAVLRATEILTAPYGLAWSPKRITISTVGLPKTLHRLIHDTPCHIAVSLHNAIPEERAGIMPAEKMMSISETVAALREEDFSGQRRLSFEYIVFKDYNDDRRHADAILSLLDGIECRVNLIAFHDIPDAPLQGADKETITRLRDYLTSHGLYTTIRASRGQDIEAACGLLNTKLGIRN